MWWVSLGGKRRDAEADVAKTAAHLDKFDRLLAREPEAADDGRGVNFLLHQPVGALEELGGDDDNRGGAVSNLGRRVGGERRVGKGGLG
jgi:hypothetical protein